MQYKGFFSVKRLRIRAGKNGEIRDYESEGRGFESLRAHQIKQAIATKTKGQA